jgi:hypothetical protein
MTTARVVHGRAERDGTVVCDRVLVTVTVFEDGVGPTPRERRRATVRFLHDIEPAFRRQLIEILHRRGARSRRAAEALDPIELVLVDPRHGRQCMVGRLEPPQVRHGELREIEFAVRGLVRTS